MPNVNTFDRCENWGSYFCPGADASKRYFQESSNSLAVDLALSCILLVFSAMAFRRFLSKPGSSLCRWTPHQTFHLSHIVFCVLRIANDAFFVAFNASPSNLFDATGAFVCENLMTVAGTFMWLSLMCFWYQVTMPPKAHLKAFQVSAGAFFVVFTLAAVVVSVLQGIGQSREDQAFFNCAAMIENFILFLNSIVMYIVTSFVGERVSWRLRHMEDNGEASVSSLRITECIFLYCCAAFAVRAAGYYVETFAPLPAYCLIGGFWKVAMISWIPLTTSFLFLAVMWRSGVTELRSFTLEEVVWPLSGFSVAMEDVPSSSGLGSNPLSQQSRAACGSRVACMNKKDISKASLAYW